MGQSRILNQRIINEWCEEERARNEQSLRECVGGLRHACVAIAYMEQSAAPGQLRDVWRLSLEREQLIRAAAPGLTYQLRPQ